MIWDRYTLANIILARIVRTWHHLVWFLAHRIGHVDLASTFKFDLTVPVSGDCDLCCYTGILYNFSHIGFRVYLLTFWFSTPALFYELPYRPLSPKHSASDLPKRHVSLDYVVFGLSYIDLYHQGVALQFIYLGVVYGIVPIWFSICFCFWILTDFMTGIWSCIDEIVIDLAARRTNVQMCMT